MARDVVRTLKRAVRSGLRDGVATDVHELGRESALVLLERSISFGHGRLALIRLLIAVRCGAEIPPMYWEYCRDVANGSSDMALRSLFLKASDAVGVRMLASSDADMACCKRLSNRFPIYLQKN